jgi:rod shape determining protein RodA
MWVSNVKRGFLLGIFSFTLLAILGSVMFIYLSHIKKIFIDLKKIVLFISILAVGMFLLKQLFRSLLICISNSFFFVLWGIVSISVLFSFFSTMTLKPYQKQRLIVFLSPKIDPTGYGYSLQQAKVAIGSGRLFGKGFFSGTQTQLGFIPESHTDFIFSVIGEEGGFLLASFVLLLWLFILWRCYLVAISAYDRFGRLLALGVFVMLAFNVLYNILMNLGLLPIIGIPLPLLSYGGSNMVVTLASLGIVQSIRIRRYVYAT